MFTALVWPAAPEPADIRATRGVQTPPAPKTLIRPIPVLPHMSSSCIRLVHLALALGILPPLSVSAQTTPAAPESEAVALPEFSVKADKISGYMATETTSGTRIATPIMNLPYSIQVITNDFFNDFQLFDLDDQIPFISNATPGDKYIGGGGGTRIRGFIAPYFRNGFIRRQAPDGSSIDRVEVVKGPASAIYGRAAPGGVINYISKKPSSTAEQMFSYSLGTYDNQRTEVSSTGPLVPTKLFYRVDGAFYDYERTTDFWYNRTMNLSGSVQYKLSATSAITLEMEHTTRVMNDFQNFVRYTEVETDPATPQTIVRRGLVFDMPTNVYGDLGHRLARFNQAGPHRRTVRQNNSYYLTFEQKLDPVFSVRANGTYTTRWFEQETGGPLEWNTSPATLTGLPTNPTSTIARYSALAAGLPGYWSGDRSFTRRTIADIQAGGQIDLTANYTIGGVKNRTLITFDFLEDETNNDTWLLSGTPLRTYMASTGYSESDINFWSRPNPYQLDRYRALPDPIFDPAVFPLSDASTFNIFNTLWGGLVSHTLELMNGRLILIGTARKDFITIHREQPLSTDPQLKDAQQKFDIFTYSTGANFHSPFAPAAWALAIASIVPVGCVARALG